MWCIACKQDVPGVFSREHSATVCARCHGTLAPDTTRSGKISGPGPSEGGTSAHGIASESVDSTSPSAIRWSIDEEMDAANRLIRRLGGRRQERRGKKTSQPANQESPPRVARALAVAKTTLAESRRMHRGRTTFSARIFLTVGLFAFICGTALWGWSLMTAQLDLWRLGMPFVLAGQASLILGLVLHLQGMWREHRDSKQTIADLSNQIAQIQHTTTRLLRSQGSSGPSFYLHWADGVSPHLLLADVQGQLDLLAQRITNEAK